MNKFKLGLSTLAILGEIGLGTTVMTAQATSYSAKRNNSVKLVWRKAMKRHAFHTTQGALYSKHLGYKYTNMSAYPKTTWYTIGHEKLHNKVKATDSVYYHVVSANGKHSGWIYRGYLKKGAYVAKNSVTPTSPATTPSTPTTTPKTPTTSSKNLENTMNVGLYRVAFMKALNKERARAGVAPATEDNALDSLAEVRAPQAAKNYSHVDSKGNFIALDLSNKMGINNFTGETLVEQDLDASDDSISFAGRGSVRQYMSDDAHKNIILKATNTHVGMGISALPDDNRQFAAAEEFGN